MEFKRSNESREYMIVELQSNMFPDGLTREIGPLYMFGSYFFNE